ncbi:cell wall endopeptidase [Klebsiella pneumoniae subsp. pneumoniae]|uniref:Cell wall endopeptidase n=1 Tax=Klebsiella pneumoniae subsp. pneumoniae TaxID=72407 RepID=A0A377YU44_KLEPN|nr:cell wall endopeptidase [Klebsiella pneumoniae subsp. pneumoniae]
MYSTDVVKENAYLSATRSGLESNEIATLQRSLPSRFNLRHLKKNESLKLVLQKKAGKSRVVAYKFTSGSFNYTAYRISDKKFYNLSDTSGKGSLDYPLPATARLSSPFNPARLNPVSGKVSPHNGIDYSMPMNTKIVSVIDGKITRAEYNSTMGYFVEVTEKPVLKLAISTSIKYSLLKGPGLPGETLLRYPVTADVHPVLICITSWSSITILLTHWRSGQRHPLITNLNSMPLRMPETTNDTWNDNGAATRPRLPD